MDMMLSFFENQTRLINALKDETNFIKEYGKDFMRAYHEEMEYAMYHSLLDDSIEINTELDRIEEKYRFNEGMNTLLDATAQHLRWAILIEHSNWKRKAEESPEAEIQVKGYCKQMMEEMNNEVHVHIPSEEICIKDEEFEDTYNLLREAMKKKMTNN